jgi:hypothetical protein
MVAVALPTRANADKIKAGARRRVDRSRATRGCAQSSRERQAIARVSQSGAERQLIE